MTSDNSIEQKIQAKGLTAPRITPEDIKAAIVSAYYFTAAEAFGGECHPSLKLLTFCVLVLRNGFTVTGESACASPENFDAELGREIARRNAVAKIWPLLGYELRTLLAKPVLTLADSIADLNDEPRPSAGDAVITGTDALFIADAYSESLESPRLPNEKLKQAKAEYDRDSGKIVFDGEPTEASDEDEPVFDDEDIAQIAELCHEANRAYCESQGDTSQVAWADAPDWQKDSAINGVKFHIENPDAGPSQSHESWLKQKQEEGWKWGPVKDAEKKEHPCFCGYDELPASQKAKDYIFTAIVKTITAIHLR